MELGEHVQKWPIVFVALVSGVISGRGRTSTLVVSMVKMSLLIAIVVSGTFAVSGQKRVKREPERRTVTGCRPAPEPPKICGFEPSPPHGIKPVPCNPFNMGSYIRRRALRRLVLQYPADFTDRRPGQAIFVSVLVNETGKVISASAPSGLRVLRDLALVAARKARFRPVTLLGQRVKISGLLVYNFVTPRKQKLRKGRLS